MNNIPRRVSSGIGMLAVVLWAAMSIAADALPSGVMTMKDFSFEPAIVNLKANHPAKLVITNQGQYRHEFESPLLSLYETTITVAGVTVEGKHIEEMVLEPGSSAVLQFVPTHLGDYHIFCDIKGHESMKGTITVK